jgi:hypothetical protein
MKHGILAGVLIAALASPIASAWAQDAAKPAAGTVLGSVTLSRKVLADGQPLAAGTYQVRLSSEEPKAVVGQSPDAARYVEFVRAGKVVGREVATVVSNADMATMAKWHKPAMNSSKVEILKGADYLRVWINRSGNNYLIHLPPAA